MGICHDHIPECSHSGRVSESLRFRKLIEIQAVDLKNHKEEIMNNWLSGEMNGYSGVSSEFIEWKSNQHLLFLWIFVFYRLSLVTLVWSVWLKYKNQKLRRGKSKLICIRAVSALWCDSASTVTSWSFSGQIYRQHFQPDTTTWGSVKSNEITGLKGKLIR